MIYYVELKKQTVYRTAIAILITYVEYIMRINRRNCLYPSSENLKMKTGLIAYIIMLTRIVGTLSTSSKLQKKNIILKYLQTIAQRWRI